MANQAQDELIDAIADETTHLRAELNAVKAELGALRDDLHRMVLAARTAPSRPALEAVDLSPPYVPAVMQVELAERRKAGSSR
ncbi:MAG: hypothetical protein JOZ42_05485 [Acetobacteraceae bacterium]|nr:hypothetical protein [Acetobacteraceae bacterium]